MNALRSIVKYQQLSRCISTTSKTRVRDMAHLKEVQRQMQVDDGVPVYLKKGTSDQLLFAFICIGVGIITLYSGMTVKRIIYPPKNP